MPTRNSNSKMARCCAQTECLELEHQDKVPGRLETSNLLHNIHSLKANAKDNKYYLKLALSDKEKYKTLYEQSRAAFEEQDVEKTMIITQLMAEVRERDSVIKNLYAQLQHMHYEMMNREFKFRSILMKKNSGSPPQDVEDGSHA